MELRKTLTSIFVSERNKILTKCTASVRREVRNSCLEGAEYTESSGRPAVFADLRSGHSRAEALNSGLGQRKNWDGSSQ